MSVKITPSTANSYLVNGVEVYQDSNNNWLARGELTSEEYAAFLSYIHPITEEKKSAPKNRPSDSEHRKKKLLEIEETIDKIQKQLSYLSNNTTLSEKENVGIRKYYQNQLKKQNELQNEIINGFPVAHQIVEANAPKPSF